MVNKEEKVTTVKDIIRYWGSILLIIFSMLIITTSFSSQLQKIILDREVWQAERVANYISKITKQEIESCENILATARMYFTQEDFKSSASLVKKLKNIKNAENDLYMIGYMNNDNIIIYNDGTRDYVTNQNLINKIYTHENYVSSYIANTDIEANSIQVAVPIYQDNEIKGALVGYYRISGVSEVLGYNEDSLRYFQIIDANGNYISRNNSKYSFASGINMWKELEKYQISHGVTIDQIKANIKNNLSGTFHFIYDDQGRYVSYEPLGINDWYIYSVIAEEGLSEYTNPISVKFQRLILALTLSVLLLIVVISLSDRKKKNIIKKQNNELIVKNKLFNMILDKSKDIPFEIDIVERTFTLLYSEQYGRKVGHQVWDDFSPESMLENGEINEDSLEDYQKLYDAIFSHSDIPNTVLKIRLNNEWRWIKVNILHATENSLVGFFEDYDMEMRQQKMIEEVNKQVMIDELTGLYRRDSFIKILTERNKTITPEKMGALILIDLDGFKEVNDQLGHALGDRALIDAAVSLKSVLRKDDLVGRLGGDEFLVYLEGIKDINGVKKCATKLNEVLTNTYEKDGKVVQVTASMGVVLYDKNIPFKELYERADEELYKVKLSSKNSYRIIEG